MTAAAYCKGWVHPYDGRFVAEQRELTGDCLVTVSSKRVTWNEIERMNWKQSMRNEKGMCGSERETEDELMTLQCRHTRSSVKCSDQK